MSYASDGVVLAALDCSLQTATTDERIKGVEGKGEGARRCTKGRSSSDA